MTYDKLGGAEAPFVGDCFNELVFSKTGLAALVRSVSGTDSVPTQKKNIAVRPMTGGGVLLRLQSAPISFDTRGSQFPYVRFEGVCHDPYVENVNEGKGVKVRVNMIVSDELVIDMATHTVKLNGEMVWGYSGRWFAIDSGDVIRAGAEGIGTGFAAVVGAQTVEGLVTKPAAGVGEAPHSALGRPQITVSRYGDAISPRSGTGHRQARGRAISERKASGVKVVQQ